MFHSHRTEVRAPRPGRGARFDQRLAEMMRIGRDQSEGSTVSIGSANARTIALPRRRYNGGISVPNPGVGVRDYVCGWLAHLYGPAAVRK